MFSIQLHIIDNGLLVNINHLREDELDSLRDCIYNIIPENSNLCMYNPNNTFAVISEISKDYFNKIYEIHPSNTEKRTWSKKVILYFKPSEEHFFLKPYKETRKKVIRHCILCKREGHNKRTCLLR